MHDLIQQMGHVTLAVPDPARSAADLVDIVGLKITAQDKDSVLLSSNRRRYEVVLRK